MDHWGASSWREAPALPLLGPGTRGGFAWFYLGIHSETRHGGGPPRDSVVLSVHGKVAATVRGLHSLKLPNLWLLETNTQPRSWDGVGSRQRAAPAALQGTARVHQGWVSQGGQKGLRQIVSRVGTQKGSTFHSLVQVSPYGDLHAHLMPTSHLFPSDGGSGSPAWISPSSRALPPSQFPTQGNLAQDVAAGTGRATRVRGTELTGCDRARGHGAGWGGTGARRRARRASGWCRAAHAQTRRGRDMYMYICICIYVYVYIHTHTDTDTAAARRRGALPQVTVWELASARGAAALTTK